MKKKVVKDYLMITLGVILTAIAVEYFLAPNNLAAGGVTGLAIVVNHFFPSISNGTIVFIVNLVLFGVAFVVIGGNFGAKTLYASFGLSVVMWIIEKFFNPAAISKDLIIATIFGTLISAVGMSIVFNYNASTGGTDILAKILNKIFHIAIGKALLMVDFLITLGAIKAFGIDVALYALLSVIILGVTIDRFIEGINTVKEVTVISTKQDEIRVFIIDQLERGCSLVRGIGGYKNSEILVLYTVLGRSEFIKLKDFIKEKDPRAFITVNEVHEVLGEGFKELDDTI